MKYPTKRKLCKVFNDYPGHMVLDLPELQIGMDPERAMDIVDVLTAGIRKDKKPIREKLCVPPCIDDPAHHLDIDYKESIVALLMEVQTGFCSCRAAATIIMEAINKRDMESAQ